jgi:hypothetical protein
VVKNSDLRTLDDLQAPEIFKDPDRDVEGVEPLERLRLRRFTVYGYDKRGFDVPYEDIKEKTLDILIPEDKTYGIRHVGFAEKVAEWAKKVQEPYLSFTNPPDWDMVKLRGGTYQDTHADELWNQFFPNTKVSGNKVSQDKEEQEKYGSPNADSIYARAEEQLNARDFKYSQVYFDTNDDDDQPGLYFNGVINFFFPKEDFVKIPNENDFRISSWNKRQVNLTLGDKIKNDIDFFFGNEDIYVHSGDKHILISISANNEGSGYATNDNDRFEEFLDEIDEIEQKYNYHWATLRNILIDAGYLRNTWEWDQLKHFKIEQSDADLWVESDDLFIGDLQGINVNDVSSDGENLTFPNHKIYQSISFIFPKFKFLKPENIKLKTKPSVIKQRAGVINYPIYVFLKIIIDLNGPEYKKYFAAIKHIDDYWEQYDKRATQWWKWAKLQLQQASIFHIPLQDKQLLAHKFKQQLPPITKKQPYPYPYQQLDLPFKDWLILSELPLLEAIEPFSSDHILPNVHKIIPPYIMKNIPYHGEKMVTIYHGGSWPDDPVDEINTHCTTFT